MDVTQPFMEDFEKEVEKEKELANGTQSEKKHEKVTTDLLYAIDETPKWYLAFFLGFQHYLTMFGATVGLPFILGDFLCYKEDPKVLSEILSTLFFCSGLVTLLQTAFGVRLPIVQGGTFAFIAPTAAITSLRGKCPKPISTSIANVTLNMSTVPPPATDEEWKIRMREIQGAIMIASLFQILLGFSGLLGLVLKFIGPLTIVPTIALVGLPLFATAANFAGAQWGVAFTTMFFICLFSQVLKDVKVPLGFARVELFKLFPVLLAILISWLLSLILTVSGALPEGSKARTDYRSSVLSETSWFRVPYPGQWGVPTVSVAAVFGMLAGVLASMTESVGDYYACARLAGAPPPPKHALNRGIGFEGLGCLITGLFGTGNGTTSYSENVGAVGITKVGSIRVVQCGAVIMLVLSVIAKFGALFSTIPDPVVGGIFVVMFGMITAVGLSNLQFVDLNSMRNLFVLGSSLFLGLVLPSWVSRNESEIDVGQDSINQILRVLLKTNMAVGGLTGFILDNLLPGTLEERGMLTWRQNQSDLESETSGEVASIHVYDPPFLPKSFVMSRYAKYCPFLPYYPDGFSRGNSRHGSPVKENGRQVDLQMNEIA